MKELLNDDDDEIDRVDYLGFKGRNSQTRSSQFNHNDFVNDVHEEFEKRLQNDCQDSQRSPLLDVFEKEFT